MNKRVKIIWRDGVKEKLHKACDEYFSKLDEEVLKRFLNIILDTKLKK